MTLAARSNFIHSDMQVPNSYTANISTAQNTVFLCVQSNVPNYVWYSTPQSRHDQDRKKACSVSGTALVCSTMLPQLHIREVKIINRKVASTSPFHFEAHAGLFIFPMKGIFDAYVL